MPKCGFEKRESEPPVPVYRSGGVVARVGGMMVYSIYRREEENEENVAFIVREFPMRLVPIEAEWRFGKAGLENCGLNREQCE